MMNLIKFGDF